MNVVELSEKNLPEAIRIYKKSKEPFFQALGKDLPSDEMVENEFYRYDTAITYLFMDKGTAHALITVNKDTARIENLCVDFIALDEQGLNKVLEFAIKQFSAITFVYVWVDSVDFATSEYVENYGFEYTGEQDYIDKEKFISKYKYVFRRKKG